MNSLPKYQEIDGDLIDLALSSDLIDVIGHGCNCFCRMKRGIAPQMDKAFGCGDPRKFLLEDSLAFTGNSIKLGLIQGIKYGNSPLRTKDLYVYNLYTQYHWSEPGPDGIPLDYAALRLCLKKLNDLHKNSTIALPRIGCGLAGGDWEIVREMIKEELKDNNVIIVNYKPKENEN